VQFRNTTFAAWNMLHLARLLKDAGGIPAHGNQRRCDQDSADGNLQTEQHIAQCKAAHIANVRGTRANDLPRVGAEHLADRDEPEEQAAEHSKEQSQNVCFGIRIYGNIDRNVRNRAPSAQNTENAHGSRNATDTSNYRDQEGFGEKLAEDQLTARPKS